MAKKFSKPILSRKINGDLPFVSQKIVDETPAKVRLDVALFEQYSRYSRSVLQKFIKNSQVLVDGQIINRPNTQINADAKLELKLAEVSPEDAKPPIIYEDDNVIVFNKPAGMLSIKKGVFCIEPSIDDYGEIVHRLDRDTSGVIIVAKNLEAKGFLQQQFQERKAHKTYYAVTVGAPKEPHAIIDIQLTRNLKRPTTFMTTNDGREAVTEYQVIEQGKKRALLELKPRTGRTHQLRIHLAYIGAPILGDKVYNPKGPKADRMYLHASVLEITIPGGKRLTFTAPLPEEFRHAIK